MFIDSAMLIGPLFMTVACRMFGFQMDGTVCRYRGWLWICCLKSELMLHGALDLFHMDVIAVLQAAYIINITLEWCLALVPSSFPFI
jgi:hypothetical protein